MSFVNHISSVAAQAKQLTGWYDAAPNNQAAQSVARPLDANRLSAAESLPSPKSAAQNDLILRGLASRLTEAETITGNHLPANNFLRLIGDSADDNPFARLPLPRTQGEWTGERGNSDWRSNRPSVNAVTGNQPVPFRNGFPDFSQWSRGSVTLENMRGTRTDFAQADRQFARQQNWFRADSAPDAGRVAQMRAQGNLVWHHHQDERRMQLVPRALNQLSHLGGAAMARPTTPQALMHYLRTFGIALPGGRE